MSGDNKEYNRLDFEKRVKIEKYLNAGMSLSWISREIDISLSTVSREVKRNRRDDGHLKIKQVNHICKHRQNCMVRALCKERHCRRRKCSTCEFILCTNLCDYYEPEICQRTKRAPYVCNGCVKPWGCRLHRYRYDAKGAQRMADTRLKETRQGINCTEEDFNAILDTVVPLLKAGIGLDAIWCEHKDSLGISKRTLYRWAEAGYGLCNMDLPKKVSYKPRKNAASLTPKRDLKGRNYADFLALDEDVRASAFEMDCIEGLKRDKQSILTLLHRRTHFQFGILLREQNCEQVIKVLDWLESITERRFSEIFSTILTDRGSEFSNIKGMELDNRGKKRCSVYFCDPCMPSQKGQCERAHVEVRKILPKKRTSFDSLTSWDIAEVFSHVNSVPRPSLGGASPLALAQVLFPEETLSQLGLRLIPLNEICLKPSLLDNKEGGK